RLISSMRLRAIVASGLASPCAIPKAAAVRFRSLIGPSSTIRPIAWPTSMNVGMILTATAIPPCSVHLRAVERLTRGCVLVGQVLDRLADGIAHQDEDLQVG